MAAGYRPSGARAVSSFTFNLISSELAFSSGAYIAQARVGKALKRPGISARMR